jgi:hypothetical protein
MKKILPIVLVIVIIAGAGAFYGGMKYAQGKTASPSLSSRNLNGSGRQGFASSTFRGQGSGAGGFVSGKIIAKDSNSITVQIQSGGSKIIFLSGSTQVSKYTSGNQNDLIMGGEVSITGTGNQDGSITAQSIQIRPASSTPSVRQGN